MLHLFSKRAMHVCPCAYYNQTEKECVCAPGVVQKYLNHISGPQTEAQMIEEVCVISNAGNNLVNRAMQKLNLGARAYGRIIKVSRTVPDLAGSEDIKTEHLAEAIQFRSLDREHWAM